MKEVIAQISALGKEIEKAKSNKAQLQGRREEILNRIKDELGVSTVEELQALKDKTLKQLAESEEAILADFDKLKVEFQW